MSDEQGLRIVLVDEIGNTTTAKLSTDDNQENDICSNSTGTGVAGQINPRLEYTRV